MKSDPDPGPSALKKSIFGRLNDFVFGYDFFVSYCWADGRKYAVALVRQLQDQGFECFLDSSDFAKGDNWRDQGRRALKKTSRLILVGTPKAIVSEPVQHELEIFSRLGRRILPIDFDGSLYRAPADSPVTRHLTSDTVFIKESLQAARIGPSPETIDAVRGTFNLLRQQQKRMRLFAIATVVFAAISFVAIALYTVAARRQAESMALVWGAQGETIFDANPVEGLYLARNGWKTVPNGSHSLNQRLTERVLRLAAQGRLTRIGTDILDAGLTDDGQLFIARRHAKGEIRDADKLRLAETLPQRVRRVSVDSTGDYLLLGNQASINDLTFAFHRRDNGRLVGYRKDLAPSPPALFPPGSPRYFYSDTGFSPTIKSLPELSQIGHAGFDIMQFHYESAWPVFALAYRDDENTRRPPDAELFDVHSGQVIHKFLGRVIEYDESRSGDYRVIRFNRPEDSVAQATVYATGSAYVIASPTGLTLWHSGQSLTLSEIPVKIVVGVMGGRPYALLLYQGRSEVWSITDRQLLGDFPEAASADFIAALDGWLLTPSSQEADSQIFRVVNDQLVSEQIDARITWSHRRADAQGQYFIASSDDQELQLRRTHDGSRVSLPGPVRQFSFPRDGDRPLFAVHYNGPRPTEIRRIADGSLLHTVARNGEVEVEFEEGDFFIINYFESDDQDSLYLSELRRNEDATRVATESDEIKGYLAGPGGEVLLLETDDGDLRVLLRSGAGYQRLDKVIPDVSGRVIFHPDPAKRTFVTTSKTQPKNAPESWSAEIHAIVFDDEQAGGFKVHTLEIPDTPAKTVRFFSAAGGIYLLMAKEGERLAIWSLDGKPRRIFMSPVGLAGFLQLPGAGDFLLWYDDGRCYVIDVQLIDLATAVAEGDDPTASQRFLNYIEGGLFNSHWLDQDIIDQQSASIRLD